MNLTTRALITDHGRKLLLAFPDATEQDPFVLAKKLRRIETSLDAIREEMRAGNASFSDAENASELAKTRAISLLGPIPDLAINLSSYGCALLITASATSEYNSAVARQNQLPVDAAGHGLLAPFICSKLSENEP